MSSDPVLAAMAKVCAAATDVKRVHEHTDPRGRVNAVGRAHRALFAALDELHRIAIEAATVAVIASHQKPSPVPIPPQEPFKVRPDGDTP